MITHCEHSSHFVECVRLSVGHIYMHLCVFCGWVSLDCRLTLLVISLYLMLLTVSSRMFDYVWRITNVQWTFAGRNKKKKKNDLSRICNRWTINYRQHTQRFMWCNACGGVFCYLLSHILGFSCTRSIFFSFCLPFLVPRLVPFLRPASPGLVTGPITPHTSAPVSHIVDVVSFTKIVNEFARTQRVPHSVFTDMPFGTQNEDAMHRRKSLLSSTGTGLSYVNTPNQPNSITASRHTREREAEHHQPSSSMPSWLTGWRTHT